MPYRYAFKLSGFTHIFYPRPRKTKFNRTTTNSCPVSVDSTDIQFVMNFNALSKNGQFYQSVRFKVVDCYLSVLAVLICLCVLRGAFLSKVDVNKFFDYNE